MKTLFISILLLLTACGSLSKDPVQAAIDREFKIHIDPKLLQACKPLPNINALATEEDIASYQIVIIGLYGECAIKQDDSIKALKKLSGAE